MLKKIKINISGIHCRSCKTLIETEVDTLPGVKNINVDHKTGEAWVEFDEQKISLKNILEQINKLNYQASCPSENLSTEKIEIKKAKGFLYSQEKKFPDHKKSETIAIPKNILIAISLLLIFIIGYSLIKNLGLLEIMSNLNESNISYSLIFIIGILASFHCIGMCGGLVIAYSIKNIEKENKSLLPHFQYNLGRLISYTIIGGILGGFGSFFGVNPVFAGLVTLVAGILMILMGASFIANNKFLEKIKIKTPDFIARFIYKNKKNKAPFIIGLLTGFMPCGPLQAMQLYALTSGSFIKGALAMGTYALGTIPLMFGFGSFIYLIGQDKIKKMIKISGFVIIILGILMLNRGLANFGYEFSFLPSKQENQNITPTDNTQTVTMELSYKGYSPNVLYIKKGIPVKWVINVKEMSGCTNEIILQGKYNIKKKLQLGKNVIEFTPDEAGEIKFSCWMKMVWGKFIVTDSGQVPQNTKEDFSQSPTCGCNSAGSCGCGSK